MFNFDAQFFEKHQSKLLLIANRKYLRWILGLNRLPKELTNKKIDKITTSSIHWSTGKMFTKKGKPRYEYQGAFFTRPRFAEALAYNLSPFVYLMNNRQTKLEWRFSPVGVLGLLALFFSKGGLAFIGTTTSYYAVSGDGTVYNGNATWATARAAATGTVDQAHTYFGADYSAAYYIYRGFIPIDCSSIADTDTVTAASLSLYTTIAYQGQTQYLAIVDQTQASNTALAAADYANITLNSPTEYCTRLASSSIAAMDNRTTISLTNLSIISKTAFTKIGIRSDKDIDNVAPATTRNYCGFGQSNQAGTTKDPYLSVTYSAIVAIKSIPTLALMGVG